MSVATPSTVRLLRSNNSPGAVACRQNYSAMVPFPLFAGHKPPPTLRALGLRLFGGKSGVAAGTLQVGDYGHKFMIIEGFHFGAEPANGVGNR